MKKNKPFDFVPACDEADRQYLYCSHHRKYLWAWSVEKLCKKAVKEGWKVKAITTKEKWFGRKGKKFKTTFYKIRCPKCKKWHK